MEKEWNLEAWKEAGAVIGEGVTAIDSFIDSAFPWLVEIGDHTVLTGAKILAHDASMHPDLGVTKLGYTKIGSRCFIGYGSIIRAGVTIGDDCIIGIGSIVTKDVPAGSVFAGTKVIKTKKEFLEAHKKALERLPHVDDRPVTDPTEQERLRNLIKEKGGYAV